MMVVLECSTLISQFSTAKAQYQYIFQLRYLLTSVVCQYVLVGISRVHWWSFFKDSCFKHYLCVSRITCVMLDLFGGRDTKSHQWGQTGRRQWRNVGEGQKGGEDRRERDDVRMQGVKDGIQRTEKEGFEEKHWEGQKNVINGVFVMVKTDIENRRIKERDGLMNRLDCWECWARKK